MKTKPLMLALIPLLVLVTVPPVMAIGPQNAEKNPHIMKVPEGVEMPLPSGVMVEWMADTDLSVMDTVLIKNAAKFKIRNALDVTLGDLITLFSDPVAALEYENTWGRASYAVLEDFFDWLITMGAMSPEEAALILEMYPDGMYLKFGNVGQ